MEAKSRRNGSNRKIKVEARVRGDYGKHTNMAIYEDIQQKI